MNIVGSPNVGKSTLMNRLVGERLSIINAKAQTTRHRIMGIVNEPEWQVVYSDTPGVLDPAYKLQEGMMRFVKTALQDADVLLVVTDVRENGMAHPGTLEKIAAMDVPTFVLVNKIDLVPDQTAVEAKLDGMGHQIATRLGRADQRAPQLQRRHAARAHRRPAPRIASVLPQGRVDRQADAFFVSEIVREKILTHYKQEIAYSCEVVVEAYDDAPDISSRSAQKSRVARDSQKHIVVGAQGRMIKRVGMDARKDIEAFLGKKVFLDLYVRVDKNWRDDERKLKRFGYIDGSGTRRATAWCSSLLPNSTSDSTSSASATTASTLLRASSSHVGMDRRSRSAQRGVHQVPFSSPCGPASTFLATPTGNLVVKAHAMLAERHALPGLHIHLHKVLPMEARD